MEENNQKCITTNSEITVINVYTERPAFRQLNWTDLCIWILAELSLLIVARHRCDLVQVVQAEDLYFSDQLDDHKSRVFDDRLQLALLEHEPNVSEAAVFVGVQAVAVVNKQLPLCGLDKYY